MEDTNGAGGDPLDLAAQHIIDKMAADGSDPLPAEVVKGFVTDVLDVLGVKIEQIQPDAKLKDDLSADSLDLVELVMAQEARHEIVIPEEQLPQLTTIADALGAIVVKIAEKYNPDDPDNTSGDREPRKPLPQAPSGSAEADLPH